jgi:uncharacterized protein YbgA (DUF1722 family)/uncharacterized protein YbbK (DUF523 family)
MDTIEPIVVVSGCLDFEACRYNAQRIPFDFIGELGRHARLVPICPEVEVGLGTPRAPVRLVRGESGPRLVQPESGRDLTREMRSFSSSFLADRDVDGFVLKSRSPSCGPSGVKVYDGADVGSVSAHGPGLFAAAIHEGFPRAALEDEGRLRNFRIREHFLTKLWAVARLRSTVAKGRMSALVDFHTRYKLVLMGYNQAAMRELGRIVANHERRRFADVAESYGEGLERALHRAPTAASIVNVLEHAWGYVTDRLNADERAYYRRQLERYRAGRLPISAPAAVIETAAVRFGVDYLLGQYFFDPYPEGLRSVADSGKGRARRRGGSSSAS